jgi:hypothetical protein
MKASKGIFIYLLFFCLIVLGVMYSNGSFGNMFEQEKAAVTVTNNTTVEEIISQNKLYDMNMATGGCCALYCIYNSYVYISYNRNIL